MVFFKPISADEHCLFVEFTFDFESFERRPKDFYLPCDIVVVFLDSFYQSVVMP
jgi:hypothetical protein